MSSRAPLAAVTYCRGSTRRSLTGSRLFLLRLTRHTALLLALGVCSSWDSPRSDLGAKG